MRRGERESRMREKGDRLRGDIEDGRQRERRDEEKVRVEEWEKGGRDKSERREKRGRDIVKGERREAET